jgi:hypothetical protein
VIAFSELPLTMTLVLFCIYDIFILILRTTIFTEYSILRKTFVDCGYQDFSEKISYQDFKEAWYAFLDLLDIDYMSTFHCPDCGPDCGPDPDTVVMDATSVAFRKELLSWDGLFRNTSDRSEPYDKPDTARYFLCFQPRDVATHRDHYLS